MLIRVAVSAALLATLATPRAAAARPQDSRCANCHFVNYLDVPHPEALGAWSQSAHGRHAVTCDQCHGGNPTTVHTGEAHRGVINSHSPASPVHRDNLPLTCGRCHDGPAAAFHRSAHQALLDRSGLTGPTCTTCHGGMAARRPSPRAVEAACAGCHAARAAGALYPALARERVEQLDRLTLVLGRSEQAILRIADQPRRQRLLAEYAAARASMGAAVDAVHTFDLGRAADRLVVAQRAVDELAVEVTNFR
jgi:nitrate/TMAO reductase-like tetraheme cytochrome c subunit